MISFGVFILLILLVRAIEFWLFLKKVSKVCNDYNWKHIDNHPELLIEVLKTDDYKFKLNWSAYKFMFLSGPHPLKIFFKPKRLTIRNIYGKKMEEKLKEYEVI